MQPRNFNLLLYIFADCQDHDVVARITNVKCLCLLLGNVIRAIYPEVLGTSRFSTAASSEQCQDVALTHWAEMSGISQSEGAEISSSQLNVPKIPLTTWAGML